MKVEVNHNDQKDGIELLFSEELPTKQATHLKDIGFKQAFREPLKWYTKKHPAYKRYAEELKTTLSKGEPFEGVPIRPSFEAVEENIDHNKFSYVTISYREDALRQYESYVVFDSYKNVAMAIATSFGKNKYREYFLEVDVYPRNYKRKARALLKEGKVIGGQISPNSLDSKEQVKEKSAQPSPIEKEDTLNEPLANKNGIYTKELAGDAYRELNIPLPKTAKSEITIRTVQGSDEMFRYGIDVQIGDSGHSYAPSVIGNSYLTRKEAISAALKEIFSSTKKNERVSRALKKYAEGLDIQLDPPEETSGHMEDQPAQKADKKPKSQKLSSHEVNEKIEAFIKDKDERKEAYTEEDKQFIKQYTGSGGLIKKGATGKGVLYEYFTPDEIVQKMWGLAFQYGYTNGHVLEPSVGIGNFLKYAPTDAKVTGFETNPTSKRIAEILYPNATIIQKPFESNFFAGNIHLKDVLGAAEYDLVIGNPPYGEFTGKYAGMGEKRWTGASQYDQYFITRGLDLLKVNGLLVFIIPSAFMSNNSKYKKIKEKILSKADLLDAYRLPVSIFKTTDIGTDIVVFKKK